MVGVAIFEIVNLLGNEADDLLHHVCERVPKSAITPPTASSMLEVFR